MINHTTHWICPNQHRKVLAFNYHKENKDSGKTMEMSCCVCLPHEDCGDSRSNIEDILRRVKYEQGQITEIMKKRYPELYGAEQQELNMEKE